MVYEPDSPLGRLGEPPFPTIGKMLSAYPPLWTGDARDGAPSFREIAADENLALRIELHGFAVS